MSIIGVGGTLYAAGQDNYSFASFVKSYTVYTQLSWSGVGDTYSIQSYQGLYDASGIATTSYYIVGFVASMPYSFTVTAQVAVASSSPSMPFLSSAADVFSTNTVDVATRKQFLIDNATSFPSPIISLSNFDITPFLTSDPMGISSSQPITMILPNVDVSSEALPDANASLYLLGTPGTTVVYTVDGVSSEIVFDSSSVTVNAVTVQIGGAFVLFGRVYSLAGCGSALVIPISFSSGVAGSTNYDGTANLEWNDLPSADSFQVEDGSGTVYQTSSLTRTSATVLGLQNLSNTFYVRALYEASGLNPSGSVRSTDSVTFIGDIYRPDWTGSNVQVVDNRNGAVTVSWNQAVGSPTYTVVYSGDLSGSVDAGLFSTVDISGFFNRQNETFAVVATYDNSYYNGVADSDTSANLTISMLSFTAHLSGVSTNDGSANLTWTDQPFADSFQVEDGNGNVYTVISLTRDSGIVSATVTGLQNLSNIFYVRAFFSNPTMDILSTDPITINGDIAPPAWIGSGVNVLDNSNGSVTVSWNDPMNGGSPTYTVVYSGPLSGTMDAGSFLTVDISGFSNGQNETFAVVATYADASYVGIANSDSSANLFIFAIPASFDATFTSYSTNHDGTANLAWTDLPSADDFQVEDGAGNVYAVISLTRNAGTVNATVSGLQNLSNTFYVRALFNAYGTNPSGSVLSTDSVMFNGDLYPPLWTNSIVLAVDNHDGSVTVTWSDVSGSPSPISYTVTDLGDVQQSFPNSSSPLDISGYSNGQTCVFVVDAVYDTNVYGGASGNVRSAGSPVLTIQVNSGGGGGGGGNVPCFMANAPVLTPTGYAPISSLAEGDKVMTGDGRVVAIQRFSHTRVAAGPSVNPYVIPKGLYGATKELLISPDHRISTANGLLEARLLGLEQSEMTGIIDYYNLELPSWAQDTMVVAGVVVESLAPVRRITMTLGQFKKALVAQYGELTPAVLAKVQKTCRLLAGGRVECPVLPTHK